MKTTKTNKKKQRITARTMRYAYEWARITQRAATKSINRDDILEICWTIFPVMILLIISLPSLRFLYYLEDPLCNKIEMPTISFIAVGHQWYWSYQYVAFVTEDGKPYLTLVMFDSYVLNDDEVIRRNGLRLLEVDKAIMLPINTKLKILITSLDVLHSWSIPSLAIKMDAIPGRLSLVNSVIRYSGIYYGQCSEICGIGHGFMPIKIISF